MASYFQILRRPVAAAVIGSSLSANILSKLSPLPKSSDSICSPCHLWTSLASISKLTDISFAAKNSVQVPDVKNISPVSKFCLKGRNPLFCDLPLSIASHPAHNVLFRAAMQAKSPEINGIKHCRRPSQSSDDVMYKWHVPKVSSAESKTVVVLLGWLGAKQKHLKTYADWYTSQGYQTITFTLPMTDIQSYKVDGKAEQHVQMLANHLSGCLEDQYEENLVFHTFSNTGWLMYGAILEKFDQNLMGSIRGCVVDSAPVAAPEPRVWASGFSAALLKKQKVSDLSEMLILNILEKFFKVVLNRLNINKRLSDVVGVLSVEQPKCPQLYLYSSADRVIPAESVESFMEEQMKIGRDVRACNFVSTPHVDHFRNDPKLYTSHLTNFLHHCIPN